MRDVSTKRTCENCGGWNNGKRCASVRSVSKWLTGGCSHWHPKDVLGCTGRNQKGKQMTKERRTLKQWLRYMREPVDHYPLTMCPQAPYRIRLPRWRAALSRFNDKCFPLVAAIGICACVVVLVFAFL